MGKRIGQHFLVDKAILDFEAGLLDASGKSVLEIGAGTGNLTKRLIAFGAAKITAVELDEKLAKLLQKKFKGKVKVLQKDFLLFDEEERFDRIIGNIPYYITSPILFKLSRMGFEKAVLCIQKEVAQRILAKPGTSNYGRLSVSSQLLFKAQIAAFVDSSAFDPKPRVDSCIISLEKTGFRLSKGQERVIGAIFSHKKKSLKNAAIDARKQLFFSSDKKKAAKIAQTLKYSGRKVFTLSPKQALETAEQLGGFANGIRSQGT